MHSTAAALPIIRPISDLRTKLNDVEIEAKKTGEPIIMTKNGMRLSLLLTVSGAVDQINNLLLGVRACFSID